jgi:D-aspartate ligase
LAVVTPPLTHARTRVGRQSETGPLACVIGDMDLVRPLGLAGVRCAVVARRWEAPWCSRYTRVRIPWLDPWERAEELIQALLAFAARQEEPPVLYYQGDPEMLAISRHHDLLSGPFRFVLPEPGLVEALADKASFAALAEQLDLPVPRTRVIVADDPAAVPTLDLRYPLVVKPSRHVAGWAAVNGSKAIDVSDEHSLREVVRRAGSVSAELILQESIPGPETRIESHHVYVDRSGEVAGDFTGRKIRTQPARFGYSTAVEVTDNAEVRELGRECVRRLHLRGVAKLDFKRDPEGRLWLLEVNPRFTLWHLPGALAGVNLPALVFADLTGRPRPPSKPVRAGTTWCELRKDFQARKAERIPALRWAAWALRADAKRSVALDDPMPFLAGVVGRRVLERAASARGSRRGSSN